VSGEPEWYERILELQLRENPETWARFEDDGLDELPLRLGFIYLAPGEAEGRALAGFLREHTDYDVEVHAQKASTPTAASWLVVGATQPAFLTLETLDAWVEWMVAAGAAEGPCAFDGWTAQPTGPDLADGAAGAAE
jgi:hypothetical protein